MGVDPQLVTALSKVLEDLNAPARAAIPTSIIEVLAPLSRPGMQLKIDMDASARIGAPLVTVREQPLQEGLLAPLTPRQAEVARLIVAGKSNPQIAAALSISVATVKDHVHAILERLGMPSRIALIVAAQAATSD